VDDNSRAFARNMFRLRVHEADGQAYEDLFVRVMQYAHPRFRPVKPQGSIGDRKNDGFDSRGGCYYQVYAPQNVRKTQGDALKKLKRDFRGLKAFWDGLYTIRRYYFVINDKYQGVSPLIEKELVTIKTKHSLEETDVVLSKDLEEMLFGLADDVIISIVGHVPVIDAGEFLFLSGFTYFIGAWIDFEKTARLILEGSPRRTHPYIMSEILRAFLQDNVIDRDEAKEIHELRKFRNQLVHGDSSSLPAKTTIDKLVLITERLRTSYPDAINAQSNAR